MDSLDQNISLGKEAITITPDSKYNLGIVGKWAKFLAIMGFISSGFVVLAGLFMLIAVGSSPYAPTSMMLMGFLYLVMGGILIVPALYLLKYSNLIERAFATDSQTLFDEAVLNLKSLFKFMGIYTIVIIGIYIIAFIVGIIFAASVGVSRF